MRYANDFGSREPRWSRARTYDTEYNAGYGGMESDLRSRDRGMRWGASGRYDAGLRGRGRLRYDRDLGMRTSRTRYAPYDREYGYRTRGGHDRDLGDRLREGWRELKHEVRDAFTPEHDRDRGRYGYRRDRW